MLRVLIVSPRFAPSNAADMHRARLLVNHASAAGWLPEVLAVSPDDVPAPVDSWLTSRLPADVPIHRVRLSRLAARLPVRALWFRSFTALRRKGSHLLAGGAFDLVFFSTTEFPLLALGPIWKKRFGVPFCIDFQDPWITDYYRLQPEITPPGGRFKYWLSERIGRTLEPWVVRHCSGFVAVSPAYLADLRVRHGTAIHNKPALALPFPADEQEFAEMPEDSSSVTDAQPTWRYVGVAAPSMRKTIRAFMRAWQMHRHHHAAAAAIRFEAIGTSYAAAGTGQMSVLPHAREFGIEDRVSESPDRVQYSTALRLIRSSDALVVFGSDDPTYTASKIYPYLLSRRPLLVIFHRSSPVVSLVAHVGGAVCVAFDDDTTEECLASEIYRAWFEPERYRTPIELDERRFSPFSAHDQAATLGRLFEGIVKGVGH
jgi:hypothetical protein